MSYYDDYNHGNYNNYNYEYQNNGYQGGENYSNYYDNKSSHKSNNIKPPIKLEEALSKSSYPKYTKDFVEEFLKNNYSDKKNAKVFLTKVENEKLFVIEYKLPINLGDKTYDVYILVYLPLLYPNYEPEFYISKKGKIGINPYYIEEKKIDSKELKLNLYNFISFDAERNNIEEIINKIKIEFNENFPIYNRNKYDFIEIKYGEKCYLDKSLSNEIIIEKKYIYKNNNNKVYDINSINDDYKKEFNDETFLEFIRKQSKDRLREKYMNFHEKFKVEENNKELKNMDNSLKIDLNNVKLNSGVIPMKKEMDKLIAIKEKLSNVENQLIQANEAIIKKNKNKNIFDKCNELIKIKNEKDMEYIVKKKAIEDYLTFLKKGFEKKIVSFEDLLKQTRLFSREIFSIEYLRKKEKKLRNGKSY